MKTTMVLRRLLCRLEDLQYPGKELVVGKNVHRLFIALCKRFPDCAVITGDSRQHRPPFHPIPVQRPFQKVGPDIMNLP